MVSIFHNKNLIVTVLFILFLVFSLYSCSGESGDGETQRPTPVAGEDTLIMDKLFANSYKAFQLMRFENGMYRDSIRFDGNDFHPASMACTGMGLISLCIADRMQWEPHARELAVATLNSISGNTPAFDPERTANGYFRHFVDLETGAQAWDSEFSTIDTAILMSGALFCKKYFNDPEISQYVDELWDSIDFESAIADVEGGRIYMTMDKDGNGDNPTHIYNEYMILAWLAKNKSASPDSTAEIFWQTHFQHPDNLLKMNYWGYELLSDSELSFLSSFVHQFNYYLCNYFAESDAYVEYLSRARQADALWFQNAGASTDYEWGLGAGEVNYDNFYHADAIDDNEGMYVSPHIIAGFLPVFPDGKYDLIELFQNGKGKYYLPGGDEILWRYSINETSWEAGGVQGIDFATMIFGIASLPEHLGVSFFMENNNFFN